MLPTAATITKMIPKERPVRCLMKKRGDQLQFKSICTPKRILMVVRWVDG